MLQCEGLTQTYLSGGRPLTVLKDITFSLDDGGFLAIVGPSGSGKTTLLGLLAGLDLPSGGSVSLDGQVLTTLTEDQRAALREARSGSTATISPRWTRMPGPGSGPRRWASSSSRST
jgi:putative ABC transport system ATP-binding protein